MSSETADLGFATGLKEMKVFGVLWRSDCRPSVDAQKVQKHQSFAVLGDGSWRLSEASTGGGTQAFVGCSAARSLGA
jgi:hypothetical protein